MERFGLTDPGKKRENNQDSIWWDSERGDLYIVADGMGGHAFGEIASSKAVELVSGFIQKGVFHANKKALRDDGFIEGLLRDAIDRAHREIYDYSQKQREKEIMGTTVSLLFFRNNKAYIAHVGDSRIYRLRKGNLEKLTKDHTEAQRLVDMGAIEENEAENHHFSHILTQAVGAAGTINPDTFALPLEQDDRFLLSSDGLFRVLNAEEVKEVMSGKATVEEKCRTLVDKTLEGGAPDNVSVIIVETGKQRSRQHLYVTILIAVAIVILAIVMFKIASKPTSADLPRSKNTPPQAEQVIPKDKDLAEKDLQTPMEPKRPEKPAGRPETSRQSADTTIEQKPAEIKNGDAVLKPGEASVKSAETAAKAEQQKKEKTKDEKEQHQLPVSQEQGTQQSQEQKSRTQSK